MDRKSSRFDEDLDVPINSQVNGRIHSSPIVVELGPDHVILAMVRADHTPVNECNGYIAAIDQRAPRPSGAITNIGMCTACLA